MRIPEQVSLYSTRYIFRLRTANWSLLAVLVLLCSLSIYVYSEMTKVVVEKETALAAHHQKIDQLTNELDELRFFKEEHTRKVERVSSWIQKVNPRIDPATAKKLAALEIKYAAKAGVDLRIALAVTKQETHFDCSLTSPTGPIGCKQIAHSHWGDQFGVSKKDLYKPEINIRVGSLILKQLKNETGSYERALWRYLGSTDSDQNIRYAQSVLATARKLRGVV